VHIEYRDPTLRRLAEDPEYKPKRWSRDVITSYRKKLNIIAAATDERDLRSLRGLHLEALKGDRKGQSSIRLNDQYRLILTFTTGQARVAIILDLTDYH